MITDYTPTLGSDPEFFIYAKKNGKLQIVTADKVLPSKENKYQTEYGTLHFDGVQAEINPRQNTCRELHIHNIHTCLGLAYSKTKEVYPNDEFSFVPVGTIRIKPSDIVNVDRECVRFGCAPDKNIYSNEPIDYPDGRRFMYRFSGGHIHIGSYSTNRCEHLKNTGLLDMLVGLDCTVGLLSVAMADTWEEKFRRNYYGKAGTYRIQPHGVEYRTLSSFWLTSPILTSLFLGVARDVYNMLNDNTLSNYIKQFVVPDVQQIIDTNNSTKARDLYYEKIRPFFNNTKNIAKNSPFRYKNVFNVVDHLIDYKYYTTFESTKTLNYWSIEKPYYLMAFESTNGIEIFSDSVKDGVFNLQTLGV